MNAEDFITRWNDSGSSERANFQQFAIELTQLLCVPAPTREVANRLAALLEDARQWHKARIIEGGCFSA